MTLLSQHEWALWESVLRILLPRCRWFGGKTRIIDRVSIMDAMPLAEAGSTAKLLVCRIAFLRGPADVYFIPVSGSVPSGAVDVLPDPADDPAFARALLKMTLSGGTFWTGRGRLIARCGEGRTCLPRGRIPDPHRMKGEQSNTSIRFGQSYMLKMMRRLEAGINPEVEVGRYLAANKGYFNSPRFVASLDYVRTGQLPVTLCSVHRYVPARGDAWSAFLNRLSTWRDQDRARRVPALPDGWLAMASRPLPSSVRKAMSPFLDWAGLLGRRTAELHVALATGKRIPAFVPEPMNGSLAKLVKALLGQTTETLSAIRKARGTLPAEVRPAVDRLLAGEGSIRKRFEDFGHRPLSARMCRIHGDYHLGQVLFTGRDFLIIDFEGEPARSLEERRRKHSPLRDVAGMLRSFHYAACVGLGPGHAELARHWCDWMCVAFLREYREFGGCIGLPRNDRDFRLLLDVYLMEKALYELRYELNNRPDWVQVPLAGILNLMEEDIS